MYGSMQKLGDHYFDVEPTPPKGTVMPVHTHNNTTREGRPAGLGTPYWSRLDRALDRVERMDESQPGVWHRRTVGKQSRVKEETYRDSGSQQKSGGGGIEGMSSVGSGSSGP